MYHAASIFRRSFSLISKMQTIQSLFLLWMMVFVVEGQYPCSLPHNFVKLSPSGKFAGCRPCPECPEGHGLNRQCGSSIPEDAKIECVPCEKNKTYSNSHGVESCKPCQECGRRNVLQECTPDQNRKCGRKCPKGYFFDVHNTDCRESIPATFTATTLSVEPTPSIWPTSTSTSTAVSSTPNIKPLHSSLMSVLSAEIPGSIKVPLVVENRSSTSVESTPSIIPQQSSLHHGIASTSIPRIIKVLLPERNETAASVSAKNKKTQGRKGKALTLLTILGIIATIVVIIIFTPTAIVCWIKCRMFKKTRSKQKDTAEIPLNSLGATEGLACFSSPETQVNSNSYQENSSSDSAESLMASQGILHDDQGDDTDFVLENYILEDNRADEQQSPVRQAMINKPITGQNPTAWLDDQGHDTDCILKDDIPEDVKLADCQYDIEDFILRLDVHSTPPQKNWKHVANRFQISPTVIQTLDNENKKPRGSAMCLLIPFLCSSKCTTLKEFVYVLLELERNDVANEIVNWFRKKQDITRCSEEGKN